MNRGTKIISEPIVLTLILTVLYVGLTFFDETTSALFVVYIILGRFFIGIMSVIKDVQSYSKDSVSARYCYDLIDEIKMYEEKHGDTKWKELNESINLESIVFKHDSHNLFNDLTVNFPKNKISVVYGKSGSGKTTLLNIILGLLKPDKGSVKINNKNLNDYNLNSFRKKIGLVIQITG